MIDIPRIFLLCFGASVVFVEAPWLAPLRRLIHATLSVLFLPPEARRQTDLAKRHLLAGCWPIRRWVHGVLVYFSNCRQCQVGQAALLYGLILRRMPVLGALGLALVCVALAWFVDMGLHALGLLGRCAKCGQKPPKGAKKVKHR